MKDDIALEDAKAMFNGAMRIVAGIPQDATFPPQMVQLLLQKHRKDSSISFTATSTRYAYDGDTEGNRVHKVLVYTGADCLGAVTVTKFSQSDDIIYAVTSPKTDKDRPQKGRVETRSYKSAVAMLDKYLLPIVYLGRYEPGHTEERVFLHVPASQRWSRNR